jgi:hypothetical protein
VELVPLATKTIGGELNAMVRERDRVLAVRDDAENTGPVVHRRAHLSVGLPNGNFAFKKTSAK